MESGSFGLDGVGGDAVDATAFPPGFVLPAAAEDRRRPAPHTQQPSRPLKVLFALMAILLIAYVVSVIARRNVDSWPAVDGWGVAAFELVGSLLCMARAFVGHERALAARLVPLALGGAVLAWSLGDFVVAANDGSSSVPLLANIIYLCFYPLAYIGVMLLLQLNVREFSREAWLDGLIAGLGAAAVLSRVPVSQRAAVRGRPDGAWLPRTWLTRSATCCCWRWSSPAAQSSPDGAVCRGCCLPSVWASTRLGDTANLFASGLGATHVGAVADAIAWPTSILLVSVSVWVSPRPSGLLVGSPGPASRFRCLPAYAAWRCCSPGRSTTSALRR